VVEPTHGVITNIGSEHLELLGSIQGVKAEEGALFDWLAAHDGIGFQNLNDPEIADLVHENMSVITFGRTSRADYQVKVGALNEEGAPKITLVDRTRKSVKPLDVQLHTPGKHTALNAAAAAAIGYSVGVTKTAIKKGLAAYEPTSDNEQGYARLALEYLPDGGRILNDTYNANPDSARVALETLAGMKVGRKGKRIAVLADMAELGKFAREEHEEVGRMIPEMKKIDVAMFFGRLMRRAYEEIALADRPAGVTSFFFRKKSKLIRVLNNLRSRHDVVLVKGSRTQKMEEVVAALHELADNDQRK
jgi:UDP-N-acetylmuramyl pentapeptide synthase